MARRSRIEFAGAIYHVINRGNYRSSIFETAGARKSFLGCLDQCCASQGWELHAWVLMGNHYHLCVETPEPNLVEGMKWLQSIRQLPDESLQPVPQNERPCLSRAV